MYLSFSCLFFLLLELASTQTTAVKKVTISGLIIINKYFKISLAFFNSKKYFLSLKDKN